METRLILNQKQILTFSTQMQQRLEVLQMTSSQIEEWSLKEYNENPFLEWEEKAPQLARYLSSPASSTPYSEPEAMAREIAMETDETLAAHLQEQLRFLNDIPQLVLKSALWICEALDSNGYLRMDLDTLRGCLNTTPKVTAQALQLVQSLEPAGVGAYNLADCLTLQLQRMEDIPPLAFKVLHQLPRLATTNLQNFAKSLQEDPEKIKEIITLIRQLNPKPGQGFSHSGVDKNNILPDFFVEMTPEKKLILTLSDRSTPRLQLSQSYQNLLSEKGEAGLFARTRFQRALWVVKSLERRKETLAKIGDILLREQEDFFFHGKTHLRPLTQQQLADEIEVHVSTISRAITNKWLSCSEGLFPLKYFFACGSKKIKKTEHLSRSAIKEHIKNLIIGENLKTPYSDEELRRILLSKEIEISRRTVAKYREELGYPAAAGRRREF